MKKRRRRQPAPLCILTIMENIVIIGGGFAGLNLAKRLDKDKYRIALVDRNNFHCFPPLFYQIASSDW